MVIPRETKRITYSAEIRKLKNIPFTETQKSLVIGTILGDGCLNQNWSKTNYRLTINHAIKQKEYVWWKYEILKPYILTEPKIHEGTQSYRLRTINHPYLSKLRNDFYPIRIKIVPSNIADLLKNQLTLAVWFMDDGNVSMWQGKLRGYHINTQSFSEAENQMLVSALNKAWNIEVTSQKNNGKYRLYIGSNSKIKFRSLIEKFILPSMKYKLG